MGPRPPPPAGRKERYEGTEFGATTTTAGDGGAAAGVQPDPERYLVDKTKLDVVVARCETKGGEGGGEAAYVLGRGEGERSVLSVC